MWPGVPLLLVLLAVLLHPSRCKEPKVNFREKEKQVLDNILGPGRYDARIRPSGENGTDGPAIVRVNLFVRSIATISDIKMLLLTILSLGWVIDNFLLCSGEITHLKVGDVKDTTTMTHDDEDENDNDADEDDDDEHYVSDVLSWFM
ncbi:PREDICTED: uncharacterized protein LOC108772974 [Cyphomyrmex costatus]|uniref:uncharacterized protein LOC108772974 n=1 Tax=Cyphomyrmex costatus TaxID=456900 RepID=UPI000852275E|nr:PREDICTED: uncharacterized protein LOC108772974 [Cyphomyrmex costatus]